MTNRKKLSSWLPVLILAGLGISVSPHQVLTRTSEVSRALSPVLSSYEVIRMAPGEIERQVRTTGELRFRFKENDFYFNLEPHDMRTPNYRAVATGSGGVRRTLPPQPVHTFKGTLAGREDIQGRFNLTEGGVEGVVYAPEGWYYVEPLRNYLPSSSAGELVVYIPAHEIGRNFGANHPHEVNPSVEGCTNTLMSVVTSGGGSERQLTFCQFSRREIADYVSGNNHCLTSRPISLQQPSGLLATATSESRIHLAWQDNSSNEIEFRVQRQIDGLSDWVEIGTTAANVTTYTDTGLAPTTTYGYRIRALVRALASGFSNEARATTLEPPPTLTRFTPTTGPAGTRVTLTGTHFLGATDVRFNGVSAVVFEVLSGTNIEAVVPLWESPLRICLRALR